jgi:predicted nucleic acid-binding protein
VILDDQRGRRIAREKGLSVTGIVGVLIEARGRDMISSVQRELDYLIEAGMWIDEVFYHRILQEFGE